MVEYCWAHKKIVEHSKNHKNHTYEYVVIKCYQKCCCQSAPAPAPPSLPLLCPAVLSIFAYDSGNRRRRQGGVREAGQEAQGSAIVNPSSTAALRFPP